jgi:hypothetical protein
MWLVLIRPATFAQCLLNGPQGMAELPFPLAGVWSMFANGAQSIMLPYRTLAFSLGLIVVAGAVETSAWQGAGLAKFADELESRQMEGMQNTAREVYGHEMRFVKLQELTGLAPLDAAIAETWQLVQYLAFAFFVSALIPKRALVHRHAPLHFFAYSVAAGLFIQVAARIVAAALFIPLAAASLELAINAATIVQFFGYLPMIWLVMALPLVVFPHAIRVSRMRIVLAVLSGLVIMGLLNVILTQTMLSLGIVLI